MRNRLLIKIAIIAGLMVLMMLPLGMIKGVVSERSYYREQVEFDIANTWTGDQLIAGPILIIPYEVGYSENLWNKETERYEVTQKTRWETASFMPESMQLSGSVDTELRFRGIYSVPVYSGNFVTDGRFSIAEFEKFKNETDGFLKWGKPTLNVSISDVRGIGANPSLSWGEGTARFEPGTSIPGLGSGIHAELPLIGGEEDFEFSLRLALRGSRNLSIAPVAEEATVTLRSTWQHPKFYGRFLPVDREVSEEGFSATWQVTSFSTGVAQNLSICASGSCEALMAGSFSVQFIETVDLYQKVTRAAKYGSLFILLTFVAFFLTEVLIGRALHPVQYVLVGVSLSIFYLLLLSLSEHVGFSAAFGIATVSCVVLIGVYLTGALKSARHGFSYSFGITILYAMLFAILLSEDFALLMGSLLLFAMLAAVMMLTRRLDWYEIGEKIEHSRQNLQFEHTD